MRGGFGTIFRRKSVPYAFFRPRGKAAQEKRAGRKNESFIFAVRVDFVDTQNGKRIHERFPFLFRKFSAVRRAYPAAVRFFFSFLRRFLGAGRP